MSFLNRLSRLFIASCSLVCMHAVPDAYPAMNPRFEIDPLAIGAVQPVQKAGVAKPEKRPPRTHSAKTALNYSAKGTTYTVKPGDNLFKILIRDYGLSNDEAESFLEDIRRENNIYDIKRLKVGQKIIIPAVSRRSDGSLKGSMPQKSVGQAFRLEAPLPPLSGQEAAKMMKQAWDSMMPPVKEDQKPIDIQSAAFSLTLDPERFPIFAAMKGGRILVDQNSSIPPLVKSLIREKDPSLRIVSESPANGRPFVAALLESAGFYSVEENFSMDFGTDPKLTVFSDFKIEKTPESLIKQDVVLINSGRTSYPPALGDFLKKEGFSVLEPFGAPRHAGYNPSRQLYQISTVNQPELIDAILSSLSVKPDKDKRVDVFAADRNGISLSVKAERYFEYGGGRTVVTRFDGDPVAYTLFRILEAKGYQVVILDAQDDFRKVSEKLLSRMRIKGDFGQHRLNNDGHANYSLIMSGIKLEGPELPQGGIFLTNLELNGMIRSLLSESGYSVTTK